MSTSEQRDHDHESDPAHVPGDGWVDEGGASHLGPATHTGSGHPHPAEHQEDDETAESEN
ncbi:hypothetical protein [Leucobacter sp. gxy201]|uniref:hypothetical protein n=1 Tax=Leucobacter sp. gxy201 TaxID=2957200 RepID=UPI003DA1191D